MADTMNDLAWAARTNPEALNALAKVSYPYVARIRKACGYFLPSGGDEEDLVQAGVIAVSRAATTWDGTGRFSDWAALVALREMMQELRKAGRKSRTAQNSAVSLDAPRDGKGNRWILPDPAANPETAFEDETPLMVKVMEEQLTNFQSAVFRCYCVEERSYKETATRLGLSVKSVDNALNNTRRRLGPYLATMSQDPRFTEDTRILMTQAARRWARRHQRRTLTGD